tara:strand:+ start:51 stop:443 length:393 start_codon:yes stop_codon:yes gene_type:complete
MKKLLGLIIFSMMFCNVSVAKVLNFECTEKFSRYTDGTENRNSNTLMLLQIDTNKKIMREWSDFTNIFHPEWKITKITDYNYYSNKPIDYIDLDFYTRASFNRWTGSYTSKISGENALYVYNCEPAKQLY